MELTAMVMAEQSAILEAISVLSVLTNTVTIPVTRTVMERKFQTQKATSRLLEKIDMDSTSEGSLIEIQRHRGHNFGIILSF